ncbi:MAG TPA: aldose 1-epimerase [Sphingomicrobium sp.]|jgi:aldose 1-epimerase|nr:aldose 1-epimerase [Sphingomicrobium sp.]
MKPSEVDLLTLEHGHLRLTLSPSIGGAISAFEWTGEGGARAILRKCHSPLEKVLDAGCFPLVPYVNRIRGGHFSFGGRTIHLEPNMADDPSPLHGQGWLNPWTIECKDSKSASLVYHHEPDEWPWAYAASQEFALGEHGLSVSLTCFNKDSEPMPCGLGEHPYFDCGPETRIDTIVDSAWTVDEDTLPVEKVPAEGRYDLKDRLVCGQDLDNGFEGWGGEARMSDPAWPYELRLTSPTAKFFQLYSPSEGGIFVAEPVTHANAALNRPESEWSRLGVRVLQSGEAMSLAMRLEVVPK